MTTVANPHILVGCYHKTGTLWLLRFCRHIAQAAGLHLVEISDATFYGVDPDLVRKHDMLQRAIDEADRFIAFDWHSRFPAIDKSLHCRGIRLIRDPRDIAISSANYHGWSGEGWLHEPRVEFVDRSYQQTMKNLDLAEAIHFEIDHAAGTTLHDMLAFDPDPRFLTVRYEDFVIAANPQETDRVGKHLAVPKAVFDSAHAKSRSTVAHRRQGRNAGIRSHIQDGKPRQWVHLLDRSHLDHVNDRFPSCAERLGYEPSNPAALQPDVKLRLRYSSKFWANRGMFERAIGDAEELARRTGEPDAKNWLAQLRQHAANPTNSNENRDQDSATPSR